MSNCDERGAVDLRAGGGILACCSCCSLGGAGVGCRESLLAAAAGVLGAAFRLGLAAFVVALLWPFFCTAVLFSSTVIRTNSHTIPSQP